MEYDYPPYTRRPREVVRQLGDLKAVEGTRVTIRARTNHPIHTATFLLRTTKSNADGKNGKNAAANVTQRTPMEFKGTDAWRTLFMEMSDDRQTAKYASYHMEFVNTAGQLSQRPIVHRIEVMPDLAPEIEILTPQKQRMEVPLSGRQPIEVRAIDPDYGLSQVRLKGTVGSKEVFNESLLGIAATPPGQVITTFEFQPKQWKLAVNDQISYWAEAADNRTAVNSESPAPNVARSRTFHFVVVADPPLERNQPNENKSDENQAEPEKSSGTKKSPPSTSKQGNSNRGDQKNSEPNNGQPQTPGKQAGNDKPPPNQNNSEKTQQQGKGKRAKIEGSEKAIAAAACRRRKRRTG